MNKIAFFMWGINKSYLAIIIFLIVGIISTFAQKANIVTEAVSPYKLQKLGINTNSVSTGLNTVPNATYVYLSARNIGNSEPINSTVYELLSQPTGSNIALEIINPTWVQFRPEVKGSYIIKLTITTSSGTDDTTKTIYAADFIGVGNFEGISGQFPKCMTCHQSSPEFSEMFDRWQVSGHAQMFKTMITQGPSYYGTSCFSCHTLGTDKYIVASNGGFDDMAKSLGWVWQGPPSPGKWDSLKADYPALVNLTTIGCESCHGPGSEHAFSGGNTKMIQISIDAGNCAQCHDNPTRQNKVAQWENSLHSNLVWSNSFAQGSESQTNNLNNCIRCHDGQGFVNFTKGQTTNTTGMIQANQKMISCAVCHDPHGNTNEYSLRFTPVGSDTLGNGYRYTEGGKGQLCMNCHKSRRDNVSYVQTNVTSAFWGPHESPQTDVFLGQNAAEFDSPFLSSPHKFAVTNACVDCHMVATPDTENVNRDKIGGHTWILHNEENNYYHTKACANCHGIIASWDDFIAAEDYDNDGTIGSIPEEIVGLERNLRITLPPVGIDSISWELIRDLNDLTIKKAYWNYQLVNKDGSEGMHNAMFIIDVLVKSIQAVKGVSSADEESGTLPKNYVLLQNYPNPFNPSTTIKYSIPYESKVRIIVYDSNGQIVAELINEVKQTGNYEITFDTNSIGRSIASGVYFYSMEATAGDGKQAFRETKKIVLLK